METECSRWRPPAQPSPAQARCAVGPTFGTQADELSAEYILCPAQSNMFNPLAGSGDTFNDWSLAVLHSRVSGCRVLATVQPQCRQ